MTFKLIVAGGRDFKDYGLLRKSIDDYIVSRELLDMTIISGGAIGADQLGEKYAE